jgi:hypothetical protein
MIPDGSIVTYVGKWPVGNSALLGDYTGKVKSALSGDGIVTRGQSGGFGFGVQIFGTPFDIQLSLQVENGLGFDSPDDIISLIRHEVYQACADFPISDSIPYVKTPNDETQQATGQPTGSDLGATLKGPGAQHVCGDPSWSFFDDPGQYLQCLTTKGLSTLGILFIGLLIGIAFIVFAESKTRSVI